MDVNEMKLAKAIDMLIWTYNDGVARWNATHDPEERHAYIKVTETDVCPFVNTKARKAP